MKQKTNKDKDERQVDIRINFQQNEIDQWRQEIFQFALNIVSFQNN